MSEAPKAAEEEGGGGKKKKGKLPIIIALALVLAGGGFFMMKGKGGEKKVEPTIKLAEKEVEMEEFLTNMSDGTTYLRAKISVKLNAKFEETKFTANIGAVRDAVNTVLRTRSPQEIRTAAGLKKLKVDLATAMNAVLPAEEEKDKPEKTEKGPTKELKVPTEKEKVERPPDWDSTTGPVLQVFLSSFATQG